MLDTRLSAAALAATVVPAGVERIRIANRPSWLAMRRKDVTASSAAALLDAHEYCTRYALHLQKTGQIEDEEVEPVITETSISLPPLLRGSELEDVAPRLIRKLRPGWDVSPSGFYYRDPAHRIGATPDFIVVDPDRRGLGLIQVKTCDRSTFGMKWRHEGEVIPPGYAMVQAIVEATLTGATWAEVAVLVTGFNLDLHLVSIPLHAGIMARLHDEVAAFWKRVDAGTPPDPDYGRDGEQIARLYAQDDGSTVDLSSDNMIRELAAEDETLAAEIKTKDWRRKVIRAEVIDKLAGAAVGTVDGKVVVTAKTTHRPAYSVAAKSYRQIRWKRSA